MSSTFEVIRELAVDATPDQVFDAVTAGTAGWLWPAEYEPRVGGAAGPGSTVTAWDPPRHFANHSDGDNGWFNDLDFQIETRDAGTVLRYGHRGVIIGDDADSQSDAVDQHTDFYLQTLRQYVENFTGQRATYIAVDAPAASLSPDAVALLLTALGTGPEAVVGDAVRLPVATAGDTRGVLDYVTGHFVGIRTPDALYRFFGRHAWGGPVSLSIHAFGEGVDTAEAQTGWSQFFAQLYADVAVGQLS